MALSVPQLQIVESPQRFKVVIAGRRFGKTHLAVRFLCAAAKDPDREVWYCAPTYKQAKMIVFKKLRKKLIDLRWVKNINATSLSFELKNGSTISLKGLDNFDNLRGAGLDFLCIDEFADIDAEAWYETLRPMLADKEGGALFIGTPKGMNWAHDLYTMALEYPNEWASFQFTTIQGGNVKPEEVEAARRSLDERTFRQEFEATFETFSGRIFYAFDRSYNLKPFDIADAPAELHCGLDFNVDNNSCVIAAKSGDVLHIFDEIKLRGSNTDEMVEELRTRYPKNRITVYPDPAGAQRKTSAGGRTDHSILRTAGFTVKAHSVTTSVRDGINAVNAKLRSSSGITSLYIDPRCKYIIESMEKHTYKPNSSIPDKESGFDHFSDAGRYLIEYLFPIRQPITPPPTRMWSHKIGK
jgi:hypothetical protein